MANTLATPSAARTSSPSAYTTLIATYPLNESISLSVFWISPLLHAHPLPGTVDLAATLSLRKAPNSPMPIVDGHSPPSAPGWAQTRPHLTLRYNYVVSASYMHATAASPLFQGSSLRPSISPSAWTPLLPPAGTHRRVIAGLTDCEYTSESAALLMRRVQLPSWGIHHIIPFKVSKPAFLPAPLPSSVVMMLCTVSAYHAYTSLLSSWLSSATYPASCIIRIPTSSSIPAV